MAKKLEEAEEEAEDKVGASAIAVFLVDKFGNEEFVRTYSVKDHGDNFLELAKEFQSKITKNGNQGILRESK